MTENEVLALAEKIKRQRKINAEYSDAAEKLNQIKQGLDNNSLKIHIGPGVTFGTVAPDGHMDAAKVRLPVEMAGDLIQFLQNYIAEKNL